MANESIKAARDWLDKQPANPCMTDDDEATQFAEYARKVADDENRDLRESLKIAKEALARWKCSYCDGRKVIDYRDGKWAPWKESTCPECNGSGFNKIATEALTKLQETL